MRPFEGLKVLDCTHVLAGPFAAYQFGILGADVIKVENPAEWDQSRESGNDQALNEGLMGLSYLAQGSNKRSLAIDLKRAEGAEAFRRLATRWADVVIENYRPGALASLGLGYDDLVTSNPRLIYASMSAFGQTGPRGGQTSYDPAIQATSGIIAGTGTPATGPIKAGPPLVDYANGMTAAFAIATALFQRERTGKGQYIDVAMFDTAITLQSSLVTEHFYTGEVRVPSGNQHALAEVSVFDTQDGLVQLCAVNRRQHRRFWAAIGEDAEAERVSPAERRSRRAEKEGTIAAKMGERSAQEWEDYLMAQRVPTARVRRLDEAVRDPQLEHRGLFHTHQEVAGADKPVTVVVAPYRFRQDGPAIDRPPPRLGEHNDEILELAGFTAEEIAQMRAADVIPA